MRVVAQNDTVTLPGEIARGNLRFITAPDLTLDALKPQLAFMLEAYTATETAATTRLEIRRRGTTDGCAGRGGRRAAPAGARRRRARRARQPR